MPKTQRPADAVTVQIKGKNLAVSDDSRDQIKFKMAKLNKYHSKLAALEVEISRDRTKDAGEVQRVEVNTHVSGRSLRVVVSDASLMAAVDGAVARLYRQLNRQKERLHNHHTEREGFSLPEGDLSPEDAPDAITSETELPEIVREHLDMKPQFEEEAVLELREQGNVFHVFLNARNETVNVLYQRSDGSYGLIEPRFQ